MKESQHVYVCERTEHKEERVQLKNLKTGDIGLSFGCTTEGGTIQVELPDGSLDSWVSEECEEVAS